MLEGQIIKNISNQYTVLSNQKLYTCVPRGKFRQTGVSPFVGDKVLFDEKELIIKEILPRANQLERPTVVNVDYAIIVTSLKKPNLSLFLLDKNIAYCYIKNIKPIICLTKKDLLSALEIENVTKIKEDYEKIHIPVFYNTEIVELKKFLKNKLVVLMGQSGAGKSSLINKMDPHLNLPTNSISNHLNRGTHTTRHNQIFFIDDVSICDTPGFSALDLPNDSQEIQKGFPEFQEYSCQFSDCKHINEQNCQIKEQVKAGNILTSRYQSYLKLLKEGEK